MINVLVDSGFWFALYDEHDSYHAYAIDIAEYLNNNIVIIPFPTLYESINTRFMKNRIARNEFANILKKDNIKIVNDESIKDDALKITFNDENKKRNLSLVDNIIRLILDDVNYKIDYLITFNKRDFIDVCQKRNIKILEK
ncbi:MAG: hypothetical protein LBQ28_05100 [Prevotellaceae bacterium]|jgi:predicted nucleic acid-binding protein|nr:hypothetical protein [Prevotellaceae bacterium]